METRLSSFGSPTAPPLILRRRSVSKQPRGGRSRSLRGKCRAALCNRRSGRPKNRGRNGHAFVARVPLNSYEKARTISFWIPSSIRRLSHSTPLKHVWIPRVDILPVRPQRKLFPTPPYLRRDG